MKPSGGGGSLPERAGGRIGGRDGKGARRYVPSFPISSLPRALTCKRFKPQLHEAQISAPAPFPVLRSGELNRGEDITQGLGDRPGETGAAGGWGKGNG